MSSYEEEVRACVRQQREELRVADEQLHSLSRHVEQLENELQCKAIELSIALGETTVTQSELSAATEQAEKLQGELEARKRTRGVAPDGGT